jgi:hypothetical protein
MEQILRHVQMMEENDKGVLCLVEKRVPQTLYQCIVNFQWPTPLSHGHMIEKYELRYRIHVSGDKSMVQAHDSWRAIFFISINVGTRMAITNSDAFPLARYAKHLC